jgi:NADH-quinone oxidoreductase subunit A
MAGMTPGRSSPSSRPMDIDAAQATTMPEFHPLIVYAVILIGFVVTNLVLTHVIGPKNRTPVKQMPYESGMDPVGDARQPFNVRFCLVAILYLVFDIELLFLYPWAVSAYVDGGADAAASGTGIPVELRGTMFGIMLVFIATLVIAYIYAWRKGVFKWR